MLLVACSAEFFAVEERILARTSKVVVLVLNLQTLKNNRISKFGLINPLIQSNLLFLLFNAPTGSGRPLPLKVKLET